MKRLFVLLVSALLILAPISAFATLTIDLDTATLDELTEAQIAIANQINKLRAADAPVGEVITLTGKGTDIRAGVDVPFAPARVIIDAKKKVEVKFTGGDYDIFMDRSINLLEDEGTYDILVEGKSEWTITIEPIKADGTIEVSGKGPYVGGIFDLPGAIIVSIHADAKKASFTNFIVSLNHQYENLEAWDGDILTNELMSKKDKFDGDFIIKPTEGRSEYFWKVECEPEVEWSITLKK